MKSAYIVASKKERQSLFKISFASIAIGFLSGCSTITQSQVQVLALTTSYKGQNVAANCKLYNNKGYWSSVSPAFVPVLKSNEDLNVTCKARGMPNGLLKAISGATGSMWGNILFGSYVGALIDHSKGTGYDYPIQLPVRMGESLVVDKRKEVAQ